MLTINSYTPRYRIKLSLANALFVERENASHLSNNLLQHILPQQNLRLSPWVIILDLLIPKLRK